MYNEKHIHNHHIHRQHGVVGATFVLLDQHLSVCILTPCHPRPSVCRHAGGMLSCVTGVQAAWPGLAARTSSTKVVVTTFYFQQNSGEQLSFLRGTSRECKPFR